MKFKTDHGVAFAERLPNGAYYLSSIIVEDGYRGQGIGSKLMHEVLESVDYPVYLYATSELGGDLKRLRSFYWKFGFRAIMNTPDIFPYKANMVLKD